MISATSILSNYSSSVSLNVSDKIQQNTFSKPPEIDQDGNGSISKDEFQTLISNISKMTGQSIDSEELFKQFDADEDGSLSKDEMKALFDSKVLPEPPKPIEDSRVNKQSGSENIIATYSDKNSSNQRTSFFVNSSI